ncbi:cobyrinate a,c-diamide synthase [Actinacidiphila sp. ITFR-21]|uniref:cobyrinate a,c-diamide synthase n=1 Tax=Actinacidiphila sp. ITFR-21 TaxID=3075199 RepID=UPI00288AD1A7|nr:cobyrinate a,c-diamide synthase [Streptomyces sp. ITFR-21]WNI14975.1 cobyrinate a,c-diamide synthase [Streptomyces sp. ITFR-21]
MVSSVPRLVIAAPASGSGKTTVATGLMAAFADRGLAVSPHKVGPDYIDPGYHALATGRPGRNLDPYLCGPEAIAPLFLHGAAGCALAVVEGVMGLFDGASGHGELASTAQVAKLLRAPVVLVVDASAQARSVAALVHGFASWDPGVRLAGVVLNKVGSARHEDVLRSALEETGVPVLGALHRDAGLHVPSRHLGLVPAAERSAGALEWVRAAAARVGAACDLDALWALARSAPPLDERPWDPVAAQGAAVSAASSAHAPAGRTPPAGAPARPFPAAAQSPAARNARPRRAGRRAPVVAVAAGPAFSFGYPEQAELLAAAGAELAVFDPLADEVLPAGTAGVVLGGGFPEAYAAELSANARLRKEVAAFAGPVAAECAGLLYLARELDGVPMCGVLDATAAMTDRLTLGYREAVALGDSVLAAAGTRLRGHEFHRTTVTPAAGPRPAWGLTRPGRRAEGFAEKNVHASYLHVHWAAEPSLARRFVERCAGWPCD